MAIVRIQANKLVRLSAAELARIKADAESKAGAYDPDNPTLTAAELAGPWTRGRPRRHPTGTQVITARLDSDLVAWLKQGGKGYQTRLNAILRRAMMAAP